MARIGILGGMGPASTIEYYRRIIRHYSKISGGGWPEIVIFSVDFQRLHNIQDNGTEDEYVGELYRGINALERTGVNVILIASNTPHRIFGRMDTLTEIPIISIITATVEKAASMGVHSVLLLGTERTLKSVVYSEPLQEKGIKVMLPRPEDITIIDNIIFNDLVTEKFTLSAVNELKNIVDSYSADAALLGCTELPLVIKDGDVRMPVIDSIGAHIDALISYLAK